MAKNEIIWVPPGKIAREEHMNVSGKIKLTNLMENLKFRRQFLFTAIKCPELEEWHQEKLDTHFLYVHRDCEISRIDTLTVSFILIGYVINPEEPAKTNMDILSGIASLPTEGNSQLPRIDGISEYLYGLTGRFVLLIKNRERLIFFHDPCGLKTLYYTSHQGSIYAASQPLLIKLVVPVRRGNRYRQYYNSGYVRKTLEHFIPAGCSLYDSIYHLVPNHYYDSTINKQIRYWPVRPVKKREFNESVDEFARILKKTMVAANSRFKLAIAITAGLDSRMILSACKDFAPDIFFYTLQYRALTENSNDIKIPGRLLARLGLNHTVIDCRKPVDKDFGSIYESNSDIPHLDDWGKMAKGMYDELPRGYVVVKGNGAEIGRGVLYAGKEHPEITTYEYLFTVEREWKGWENIPFIRKSVSEWYDGIKAGKVNHGYQLLDLFLWEHRMGSWQSQSQLEWDIVYDAFTPFNNRELINILLSVDPKYRCYGPEFLFFKKAIKILWEETLQEPINPVDQRIRQILKNKYNGLLMKLQIKKNQDLLSSK
jgi:hypothetical protein